MLKIEKKNRKLVIVDECKHKALKIRATKKNKSIKEELDGILDRELKESVI